MKQNYRITITQEQNYVSAEAIYHGPADVNKVIEHVYSAAIDDLVKSLFGRAYELTVLSRKTISDVRAHEYKLTPSMFYDKQPR